MYVLFAAITIFVAVVIILIYVLINEKRMNIKERLDIYTGNNTVKTKDDVVKSYKKSDKKSALGIFARILPLDKYFDNKRELLLRARLLIKPEELFGICIILGLTFYFLFYLITGNILVPLIGFIIGFKIPVIYVNNVVKNRAKKLNNQLPEALNILANGLRAGLSFNQAMVVAAKEMDDPIADDLNKIVHDNVLGKEMDEALRDFADRTADDDVEILVTAVLIQRQVGGNLSEILDTISNTIRDRVKLKGDIRTMTAQSKLSALIVGAIPPFIILILYLLNKDFLMPLFTTLPGNIMLGVALFMQGLGIFILSKLLDLKV